MDSSSITATEPELKAADMGAGVRSVRATCQANFGGQIYEVEARVLTGAPGVLTPDLHVDEDHRVVTLQIRAANGVPLATVVQQDPRGTIVQLDNGSAIITARPTCACDAGSICAVCGSGYELIEPECGEWDL